MDFPDSKDNLIIFTTAPTGLGHIRVMDALREGLPDNANIEFIGLTNINATKIHTFGSRIRFLQKITEFYQTNPAAEQLVTSVYQKFLYMQSSMFTGYFDIIEHKYPSVKKLIVVCTHYALAYAITYIKPSLEKKFKVRVSIFVIMTDDSPQRVWAVNGADVIFAPSQKTADKIKTLLQTKNTKVITVSFPVSPRLTQKLNKDEFSKVQNQLDPQNPTPLQIEIPISGAAVQLPFIQKLINKLSYENFEFTVVGQEGLYTALFFLQIRRLARVQTLIGADSRQTVNFYESVFNQEERPAVEITKPSEQVFKAILKPGERGGVILLLTSPIGRQEKDNMDFLLRHDLMPDNSLHSELDSILLTTHDPLPAKLLYRASHWRALKLPEDPHIAAVYIKRLRETGLLLSMLSYVSETKTELTSDGVKQIWENILENSS